MNTYAIYEGQPNKGKGSMTPQPPPQSIPSSSFKPRFDTSTTAGKIAVMQEAVKLGYYYVKQFGTGNWWKFSIAAGPQWDWYGAHNGNVDYNFPLEPKRVLIPWTKDTVPREAWFREKGYKMEHRIVACTQENICFLPDCIWVKLDSLDKWEHSLDGGKTWLPCGTWKEEV